MRIDYISYSRLSTYESCPKKYYFLYEKGLHEEPHPLATLGNIIHYALERMIGHKEDWRNAYYEAYKKYNLNDNNLYKEGIDIIQNVIKRGLVHDDAKVLGTEIPFEFKTDNGVRLKGIIDRVDKIGDKKIEIVDYKSGKNKYPEKDLKDNLQASIYAIAIFEKLYPDTSDLIITFDFLRYGRMTTYRTQEELVGIKDYLLTMQNKIEQDTNPFAKVGFHCRWCSFKNICDEYKKKINLPTNNIKLLHEKTDEELVDYIYNNDFKSRHFGDLADEAKQYLKEKMTIDNKNSVKGKESEFIIGSKKRYKFNQEKIKNLIKDKNKNIDDLKSLDNKKIFSFLKEAGLNDMDYKDIDVYDIYTYLKNNNEENNE